MNAMFLQWNDFTRFVKEDILLHILCQNNEKLSIVNSTQPTQ